MIIGLKIELIVGAKILKLNFLPIYFIKLIFFYKRRCLKIFSSICAQNISSFEYILGPKQEIKVAKLTNFGCFHPKPYLKTPKAQFFLDKNDCLVEIIKGGTQVKNLRYGAAVVTKIVKNT